MLPEFMRRDPAVFLGQFLIETERRDLNVADVVYVVKTMARELLPGQARRNCRQASLFGDWIVHEQRDRSAEGQAAIATIAEAMPRHGTEGRDEKWLEEQVNSGISFGSLRLDLLAIARHHRLPETWFTSWERWQRFGLLLAFEVSGRTVALDERGAGLQAARARIQNTPLDSRHHPAAMMLVLGSDDRLCGRSRPRTRP